MTWCVLSDVTALRVQVWEPQPGGEGQHHSHGPPGDPADQQQPRPAVHTPEVCTHCTHCTLCNVHMVTEHFEPPPCILNSMENSASRLTGVFNFKLESQMFISKHFSDETGRFYPDKFCLRLRKPINSGALANNVIGTQFQISVEFLSK